MIRDRVIVCFASSWYIDPTSKHHVMRLLSEHNDVIWVNYHASRRPTLSKGDAGAILQKIKQAFVQWRMGPDRVAERLQVITPLLIPLPGVPLVAAINRRILVRQIRKAMRGLPGRPVQLWTFAPDVSFMAGRLGEEALVYYCVDEFSEFEGYDRELIQAQERELMEKADVVFTTARALQESKAPSNPNTHLVPHGVEFEHFARALDAGTEIPKDVRDLPGPIVGFFGLMREWVDVELLEMLARKHPDWSLVLIGDCLVDASRLFALDNVHHLGRRPYGELPGYAKAFDVALIPFRVNELTRHVNPIKLREYLSAGCPVVSTPLPEVRVYEDQVALGEGDAFVAACEEAIREGSRDRRRERSDRMREEAWPAKVEQLSRLVEDAI